jgi:hypothetical protein
MVGSFYPHQFFLIMYKISILLISILYSLSGHSQNLVLNGSFEEHNGVCNGQLQNANNWSRPTYGGTPDFFHDCILYSTTIPNNVFGVQYPRNGMGYAGFSTYTGPPEPQPSSREYVQGTLDDTLVNGQKYCVEFYVSLGDISEFATNNLAILFSKAMWMYEDNMYFHHIETPPDLKFDSSKTYADTSGWMLVSGLYTARGDEKYFIIGNFNDNANTQGIVTGFIGHNSAYYYIDDVNIYKCDTLATVAENREKEEGIKIFPNPASGYCIIRQPYAHAQVQIFDICGGLQKSQIIHAGDTRINIEHLPAGTYMVQLQTATNISCKKLVINK